MCKTCDCFVYNASPAHVKRFGDHFIITADNGRGQKKWIFTMQITEVDRQIRIIFRLRWIRKRSQCREYLINGNRSGDSSFQTGGHTGFFCTGRTEIGVRKFLGSPGRIGKVKTLQDLVYCNLMRTGSCAWRIFAEQATCAFFI